jgi:hypothetical protein
MTTISTANSVVTAATCLTQMYTVTPLRSFRLECGGRSRRFCMFVQHEGIPKR